MFSVSQFARHLSFTEKLLFLCRTFTNQFSLIFSFLIRLFIFELGMDEIFAYIYKNIQFYISVLFPFKVLNLGLFFFSENLSYVLLNEAFSDYAGKDIHVLIAYQVFICSSLSLLLKETLFPLQLPCGNLQVMHLDEFPYYPNFYFSQRRF